MGVGMIVTDEHGRAIAANVAEDIEYRLQLSGSGYQPQLTSNRRLSPDKLLKLTIRRAVPASGTVKTEDGQPVAGVKIRDFLRSRPRSTYSARMRGRVLATTNLEGQFKLDQLEDGSTYHLLVEHPDFVPAILAGVHPGDTGLCAKLVAGVEVEVVVDDLTGNLAQRPRISWQQKATVFGDVSSPCKPISGTVRAERHDGRLVARISRVRPGPLQLTIDGQSTSCNISADDSHVEFAYTGPPQPETCQVILLFVSNGEPVRPKGHLQIRGATLAEPDKAKRNALVPVHNGTVSFRVETPAQLYVDSEGLIGFWFSEHDVEWPEIQPGPKPLEIPIEVRRAGAVEGRVLRRDGSPAAGLSVHVDARLEVSSQDSRDGKQHNYVAGQSAKTGADGTYFVTPIPFAAKCAVAISEGFYRQVSDEFTMSPDDVSPTVSLTMHQKTTLSGQVLDPKGKPAVSFPVALVYDHPHGSMSWEPPELTDSQGRFQLPGVNAKVSGTYAIKIMDQPGIQPLRVPLKIKGGNLIRLKKGNLVSGTVVDLEGTPVPGVEVYAHFEDYRTPRGFLPYINADAVTDAEGRFQFTTLPDMPMVLATRQLWGDNQPKVIPGRTNDVILRGKIALWYARKLKSRDDK